MTTFRVHAGGEHIDVSADNPEQARKIAAKSLQAAAITKVKVLKEASNG